ncbi:MAG: hypothetical protein ACYCYR_10985 [Desulfobulbaceae bacterium]
MIEKIMPPEKYRTARLLLWVTLVSNLLCLQAVSKAAQWTTEIIDDPRYFINLPGFYETGRNIIIPNDGTLNILYGDAIGDLLIAKKPLSGGAWQYLSIVEDGYTNGATFPSFAFDAQSRPHVTYTEQFVTGERNIQSAVHVDNNWQVETVVNDVNTNCTFAASIAVDALANEHILYSATDSQDSPCGSVKYAVKNGNQWSYETIDTSGLGSIMPKAMTLDSSSSPHVIYVAYNGTNYELKYAFKIGNVWQITVVTSDVEVFPAISMALDNIDRPHVTFPSAYPNYGLKYAFYDGTAWQIQDMGVSAWDSSLALDKNSRPHISYRVTDNSGLFYAFYDGTNWQVTNVDTDEYAGMLNSIAIDSQSNIHISYQGPNWNMMHAWYDGLAWQKEIVDISHLVQGESIALDSKGNPHISYGFGPSEIHYAFYDGLNWQSQTIYSITQSSNFVSRTSLALDSLNHPHMSFFDWEQSSIKYGYNDGSGWQFQVLSPEGIVTSPLTSLILDAYSNPHVVYFDETNNKIQYLYLLNNNWEREEISIPFVTKYGCYELTLLLDPSSSPHIQAKIDTSLYYSFKNEMGWQIELVRNNVNSYTSGFALDKSSNLYATYQDSENFNFWYGHRDETGWQFEEVDLHGKYRGYASNLLFDKLDKPHITYTYSDSELNEYYLKHAYYDGDAWQVDIINSDIFTYSIDSVLGPKGQLHISYIDSGKNSLEYATASFPYPKFPWWSFWPTIMKAAQDRSKQ